MYSDTSKFETFLAVISNDYVLDLYNSLTALSMLDEEKIHKIGKYVKYSEMASSEFFDQKLENERQKFNKSFMELFGFINQHFFTDDLDNKYKLYPDHKDSPIKKEREFWIKKHQELIKLASKLKNEYDIFIKTVLINLRDKSENGLIKKVPIIIDSKNGIYIADDPKKNYPIRNTSKRLKVIGALHGKGVLSSKEINQYKTATDLNKSIKNINKNFSKLGLKKDLISSADSGGYYLNTDDYDITLKCQ